MSRTAGGRPVARRRARRKAVSMAVPPGVRLRVTADDFWRLCVANRDLRLERTARGRLIVMAPAGSDSGMRNADLTAQVVVWAKADGTGVPFDSSAGFTLPNGAVRAPDASWIVRERWDALTREQKDKFSPICPDFVVELTSPSDTHEAARKKLAEYIEQGARLGWLIHRKTGAVEVYRPGRPVEVLKRPATLSGEDVLPGFELDLKGILFD